jgi:AhpD family alkylhydroperoxidase
MTRKQVYNEIKDLLGSVPSMFQNVPNFVLEDEWNVFKKLVVEENTIPPRYKELIGIALAGLLNCRQCAYLHTRFAELYGATNEEIQEARLYGKQAAGWSIYLNGEDSNYEEFRREIDAICEHVGRQRKAVS